MYQRKCELGKWPGKINPADLGTKFLCRDEIMMHLKTMGFMIVPGRSGIAPVRPGAPPRVQAAACEDDLYEPTDERVAEHEPEPTTAHDTPLYPLRPEKVRDGVGIREYSRRRSDSSSDFCV